ncbi:MAG: DUF192 domain-containing protein [Mesorhizobium sp.]|jgi:Uncharacterized ACR, COG1430|nr:DUF192 domain-containing protein [Mesorhizobium sp.]
MASALPGLILAGFALSVLTGSGEVQPAASFAERCTLYFSGNVILADVPVARTPEQMAQGLMFREDVGPGMLFSWPSPKERVFWMRIRTCPFPSASSRLAASCSPSRTWRRTPTTITTRQDRRRMRSNSPRANLLGKA